MKINQRRYSIPDNILQSSMQFVRMNYPSPVKNKIKERNKTINKTRTVLLLLIHSEHVEQLKTTECKINNKSLYEIEQVYASELCIHLKAENYSSWNNCLRGNGEMYSNRHNGHERKSLHHVNTSDDDDENHYHNKITRRRIGWQKLTRFTKFLKREAEYQQFLFTDIRQTPSYNNEDFDTRSFRSIDIFTPLVNNLVKESVGYLRKLAKTIKASIVKPRKSVSYSKRIILTSTLSPVKSTYKEHSKKPHKYPTNNNTKNDYIKIINSPEILREEDEDSYYKNIQGKSNKQIVEDNNDDDNQDENGFIKHSNTTK